MHPSLVLVALVLIALVWVLGPVAFAAYQHWRRPWRLVCPRAGTMAQISVSAVEAAVLETLGRGPQVAHCSLWPERLGCRQECLALPVGERQAMHGGEAPPRARAGGDIRTTM